MELFFVTEPFSCTFHFFVNVARLTCTDEASVRSFSQADFGSILPIHGVGTQGHASVSAWVTRYKLAVSLDGVTFVTLKEKDGDKDLVRPRKLPPEVSTGSPDV